MTKIYVTEVFRTRARHLRHTAHLAPAQNGVVISGYVPWERVCCVGLPSLEVTDEVADGGRTYTSRLRMVLRAVPSPAAEPAVFLLTLADGSRLLLGLSFRPFPLVTLSASHPSAASERAACTLTAEWRGAFPALRVVAEL